MFTLRFYMFYVCGFGIIFNSAIAVGTNIPLLYYKRCSYIILFLLVYRHRLLRAAVYTQPVH